jgi:hypothetical protein
MSEPAKCLQAMMARACFEKTPGFTSDLETFLRRFDIADEDVDAILASPRRLALYRMLVRHNVSSVIRGVLDRTCARLERRVPGELDRAIAAFLDGSGPKTPHIRDVPAEFFAFIAPQWERAAKVPPWLVDLARLELADFRVSTALRTPAPTDLSELSTERRLVFSSPVELVRVGWAVHEITSISLEADPPERHMALLAYRDGEHRSRFLELSPLAVAIVERLLEGEPLRQAILSACEAERFLFDDAVLASTARLLSDLGQRGILLGAASS